MDWYFAQENKPVGPLTKAEFDEHVRMGMIRADTLVWNEEMESWRPYRDLLETAEPAGGVDLPPPAPSREEEAEQAEEMDLGREVVSSPEALSEAVRERGYELEISRCLEQAWRLVLSVFPFIAGVTCLILIIQVGLDFFIPHVGALMSMFLHGPLMGGLNWMYLRLIRGEPAEFEDAFSGFGPRFLPLVLGAVIPSLVIYAFTLPALAYGYWTGQLDMRPEAFDPTRLDIVFWVLALGSLVPIVYFSICWTFVLPLIIDKGVSYWDAMTISRRAVQLHWWQVFALVFVGGLIGALGMALCCVGVFATLPLYFAMVLLAYETIFGRLVVGEPPPPSPREGEDYSPSV